MDVLTVPSPTRAGRGTDVAGRIRRGGQKAKQLFIEFEAPFSGLVPEARDYKVRIQARVGHRKGWRSLLTFTLRTTNIVYPDRYTVYSNAPLELTKEDRKKADAALLDLLEGQEKGPSAKREVKRRDSSNDEDNADPDL
ncbi:hypothetical protein RB196_34145 [Streptomyces sp. PmtA]|uniref:hypothetical protein n=1 Tax=Streptomyces sp. PmtA TaxID=3074275 RepID=UPI003014EF9A